MGICVYLYVLYTWYVLCIVTGIAKLVYIRMYMCVSACTIRICMYWHVIDMHLYVFVCIVHMVCIASIDSYWSVLICINVYWHLLFIYNIYIYILYIYIYIVCNGLYS